MSDEQSLLEDFKPFLRYDSNEGYFADSAAEMTDASGNLLRSGSGATIAESGPAEHDLSLNFLAGAGGRYANGTPAASDDVLSVPGRDYLDQYRGIRVKPGYANVVYGRLIQASGITWLQYWFWFFYNDLRAIDVGLGLHEGDWEGIQLRIAAKEPNLAVYAQHGYAEAREWSDVERRGRRPVVYVAQGRKFGIPDLAAGERGYTEALGIPIVSGNVSLYNDNDGRSIPPTPVVGCVGLVADVRRVPQGWRRGDKVSVVRGPSNNLLLDLDAEAKLIERVFRAAPALSLAHDVSDGGLEAALREMAEWSGFPSNNVLLGLNVPNPDTVRFVLAGATVPDFAEEVATI